MLDIKDNGLLFDEETHTYTLNDNNLISTTQLMVKVGLAPDYSNVDMETLKKKAQKGTLVHKEIEDYIKGKEIGFTSELGLFMDYYKDTSNIHSETMVDNGLVAGQIDLLFTNENGDLVKISDIKNTYELHKRAISFQESIYRNLLESRLGYQTQIEIGECCWFHPDENGNIKMEIVEIPLRDRQEINELMECYKNGIEFKEWSILPKETTDLVYKAQSQIVSLIKEQEKMENQLKSIKEQIASAMEKYGYTSFINDEIKIVYTKAYQRKNTKLDESSLIKDNPNLDLDKYKKITYSNVKASLKIELKEKEQCD